MAELGPVDLHAIAYFAACDRLCALEAERDLMHRTWMVGHSMRLPHVKVRVHTIGEEDLQGRLSLEKLYAALKVDHVIFRWEAEVWRQKGPAYLTAKVEIGG